MGARILAVADVYDALLSHRPDRKGWDKDVVIGHIHEKAGLQFDPEVLRALTKIINKSSSQLIPQTHKALHTDIISV